jgi:hypothetical protein
MFHEYSIIPLFWKELWRKIMSQDCEIRFPGLCQEVVGSLSKNKLRIKGILLGLLLSKLFARALLLLPAPHLFE